jgi:hypothetical protein
MPKSPDTFTMPRPAGPPSTETPVADGHPTGRGALVWDSPWLGASFTAMCLLSVSPVALASPAFVVPAGVTEYRLAFVTDETRAGSTLANSSDIADYNLFAASNASNNTSLPATTWKAIVSTAAMSAGSNISCGATCDANVPIFLVDGTEVATSTINLFDASGGILHVIDEDPNGSVVNAYVWTGSNSDGTADTGHELGSIDPMTGFNVDPSVMLSFETNDSNDAAMPIYAISGELSAIPEPASLSLLAFGGMVMGLARKLRRRRRPIH